MSSRGFSIIELLVAASLLLVVTSAIASLVPPLRVHFERFEASGELEPAGRAGIEALLADLREAGSDAAVTGPEQRLARSVARVLTLSDLESRTPAVPGGAVRVFRVSSPAAQGLLSAAAPAGSVSLALRTTSRCAGGAPACSFGVGGLAILYDEAIAELVTISGTGAGFVTVASRLTSDFGPGAVLAALTSTTYGVRRAADGAGRLVRLTTGGAEQPVIDGVVGFEVTPDSVDPARVESVQVTLRLESPTAALRGPAGYLFRRDGTARSPGAWLPDIELRTTVALRNPSGAL